MVTAWVMVGRSVSGLIVCTPVPGMLNAIVPPPMLLASVIAWRNEPVPVSLVFMTVKTKGATGLSDCVIPSVKCVVPWRAVAGWLRLSTFANVEASNIDKIGNSATASVIRSAKARMGVFFFIFVLLGLICFLGEFGEWSGLFKKRAEKRQVFCCAIFFV
jgi:hypothetical protein